MVCQNSIASLEGQLHRRGRVRLAAIGLMLVVAPGVAWAGEGPLGAEAEWLAAEADSLGLRGAINDGRNQAGPSHTERANNLHRNAAARERRGAVEQAEPDAQQKTYTWSIFGFTSGADVGEKGDRTLFTDSTAGFSRTQPYRGLRSSIGASYGVTDALNFSLSGTLGGSESLPEQSKGSQAGASVRTTASGAYAELKYQLLRRNSSPFGLALDVTPFVSSAAQNNRTSFDTLGAEIRVLADAEILKDRLFAAANIAYTPERTRFKANLTEANSELAASLAAAYQVTRGVFVGSEVRLGTVYGGYGLDTWQGWALFAGPTAYVALGGKGYIALAWSYQIAGRASADPAARLDVVHFERSQARLKTGLFF